jgi:hypothetical protein
VSYLAGVRSRAALAACLVAIAGCGSGGGGLQGPKIGKARSFALAGFEPAGAVKAGVPTTVRFHITQPSGATLRKFKTGAGPHTGVHLIFVRKDLDRIIHLHPPLQADGSVSVPVTFPTGGPWHVLVDVYPDLGANTLQNFQLTYDITVSGAYKPVPLPALNATQTAGGDRFAIRFHGRVKSLKPQFFDVSVTAADGTPARFGTWYGATAHAIFFRKGSLDYFHTHVCRPEATACTRAVAGSAVVGKATKPGQLQVGTLLPTAGTWKLFLQTKIDGKVLTVPYTLKVS